MSVSCILGQNGAGDKSVQQPGQNSTEPGGQQIRQQCGCHRDNMGYAESKECGPPQDIGPFFGKVIMTYRIKALRENRITKGTF